MLKKSRSISSSKNIAAVDNIKIKFEKIEQCFYEKKREGFQTNKILLCDFLT